MVLNIQVIYFIIVIIIIEVRLYNIILFKTLFEDFFKKLS